MNLERSSRLSGKQGAPSLYAVATGLVAFGLLPLTADAQVRIWDGGGNGVSWLDAANWSGDEIPDTAGEDAVIDDNPLVDSEVTLNPSGDTTIDIGSLTIDEGDTLNLRYQRGTLNLTGGLSNSGTLLVSQSPDSNARTFFLNVSGTNQIFNTSTGEITIGSNSGRNRIHTIMTLDAQNQNDGTISVSITANADRDTARFRLENSGTFTNNGSITIRDTQANTSSSSRVDLLTDGANVTFGGTGSLTLDIGTLSDTGRARIDGNTGSLDETLTNGVDHTINGAGRINGTINVFVNDGLVEATGATGELHINSDTSVTNSATGRLVATGAAGLNISNGGMTFVNNGHMEARTGSSISMTTSSSTLNGVIAGGGTYNDSLDLTGSATIAAGDFSNDDGTGVSTIGTLTVDGALVLADSTELDFQLGSAGVGGTDYDLLNIIGGLTLDGILNIESMAGFGAGTYRLITFASGSLTDNGLTLGDTPSGYSYSLDADNVGGFVDLTVVPEPAAVGLLMGAGALLLVARRRVRS